MVVGFALLPASILAGLLWDGVGPASPFWFGAACAAASTLLLLVFVRLPKPPAPPKRTLSTDGVAP